MGKKILVNERPIWKKAEALFVAASLASCLVGIGLWAFHVQSSWFPLFSPLAILLISSYHLQTTRRQNKLIARRSHEALIDTLTSVHNRRAFEEDMNQILERAKRRHEKFAVAFIDMDYLKTINDSYGHGVGDEAIFAVAASLSGASRVYDRVYRLGGDEFAMILPDSDLAGALGSIERAKEGLAAHTECSTPVSISSGIACFPEDGADAQTLLQVADSWLYRAKKLRPSIKQPQLDLTGTARTRQKGAARGQLALVLDR